MTRLTKFLVWFVVAFHAAAFVLEAFLWMQPLVRFLLQLNRADDAGGRIQRSAA